jgi:protease-4
MAPVKNTLLLALCPLALLPVGCGCLPPMRVHSQGDMNVSVRTPLAAKVDATVNTISDPGAFREVVIPPCLSPTGDKIALIDVDGLLVNFNRVGAYSLGENPVASFQEKLTAAAADPAVKAVVLRINSPGGGVAAAELMGRSLADFRQHSRKPVVACLLDLGTGGGYYLASGCDHILAIPAAVIGGIGVKLNLYYLEIAMEQWNVFGAPVKSGERIDMGTPTRKMTAEEKAMLTSMAREYHENFKQVVLRNRPRLSAKADLFDGRVMTASKAAEVGLIDGVGFLPDALERARQLAGLGPAQVVMYSRCTSPARTLYDVAPNRPVQGLNMPFSVPGLDRSRLPLFLYLWEVDPTMMRIAPD